MTSEAPACCAAAAAGATERTAARWRAARRTDGVPDPRLGPALWTHPYVACRLDCPAARAAASPRPPPPWAHLPTLVLTWDRWYVLDGTVTGDQLRWVGLAAVGPGVSPEDPVRAFLAAGGALAAAEVSAALPGHPARAALLLAWAGPAAPPRRVVALDVQRDDADFAGAFAGSQELQFAVADLCALGHDAHIVRLVSGLRGERVDADLSARLATAVAGADTVLVKLHVSEAVAAAVRGPGRTTVFLSSHHVRPPPGSYDAVVDGDARFPVLDAVERLARGLPLPPAPAAPAEAPERRRGPDPFARPDLFAPATRYRDLSGQDHPYARMALVTNRGCPYSAPVDANPVFAGLAFEPGTRGAGCSFCEMGGDYARLPVPDPLGFLAAQVRYLADHAPGAELLVRDEGATDGLDRLIHRLVADGVSGVTLLCKARIGGLRRRLDALELALDRAGAADIQVVLFLIGIESFSDTALQRFNKGVTAAEVLETLEALRGVAQRHPAAFSIDRYRSHGFVMFDPWTTLAELRQNLDGAARVALRALSGKAPYSRLRMYRWQPLYALARRDGLVGAEGSALQHHLGYASDEVAWHFADPKAALVYDLVRTAVDRDGESAAWERLEQAVAYVEAGAAPGRSVAEHEARLAAWVCGRHGLPDPATARRLATWLLARLPAARWRLTDVRLDDAELCLAFAGRPDFGLRLRRRCDDAPAFLRSAAVDLRVDGAATERAVQLFARAYGRALAETERPTHRR